MQRELNLFKERRILSVSQVVHSVKSQLESQFRDIWVRGEISNFKTPPSGHCYFTLKDSDAQIRVVCFRMQSRHLKFAPEDGMDVLARGSLSVYPPRGEFQLVVEYMEPVGRGALQVAFEQLKDRLGKEGLFDPAHRQKLPLLPTRIGVVTSPSGAAVQDILKVLKRRNEKLSVLIFPVRVQGAEAAREITRGLKYLNTRSDIDVIIVSRGGGSIEDLWAFNEESVARAIYNSSIPVISAVGHEVDFTIADFVADLRAATPSAAAEVVSEVRAELLTRTQDLIRRAAQGLRLLLLQKRRRIQQLASSRAFLDAESRLKLLSQRLDELHARLASTLPRLLEPARRRNGEASRDLMQRMRLFLQQKRQSIESWGRQLGAFSPLAVLERGYAIVTTQTGEIVRDPVQVTGRETIDIQVARGRFRAKKEKERGI